MMEVKIYIETTLCGPGIKDGWYAAAIEYMTGKGPAVLGIVGMEKETTYYRSVLLAAVKALERLRERCGVRIYTRCSFVKDMVEKGNLESWGRSGWVKPGGGEVANKELWQQLLRQLGYHRIEFCFSRHHGYKADLWRAIEKAKKEG